ncbi:class F sortase [Actinacidiphila acidipaludis]|uniref:Class F sortase n=1 Tax=Actinacidiphila acidipaludis TaxID=2873382 RepID=A0ABS7QAH6_9ACTN|nr:class F sortase [Streptomyces acidipaludis]MBY8879963.1 class F sortase [Streptomyces acidipaludis]
MGTSRPIALGTLVAAACLTGLLAGCGGAPSAAPAAAGTTRLPSPDAGSRPSAGAAALRPAARSVPVRLQIPDIAVDTPVMGLGLASDGTVEVPPVRAHSPAGWYRGSPTPGQIGPSVLLGHVTVGRYGDGVFLKLSRLTPGARIVVGLRDGVSTTFTVDAVRTVAKDRFPTQAVYGNTDRPEVRLITCGGPRTGSGYLDNVIVFASLTAVTPP